MATMSTFSTASLFSYYTSLTAFVTLIRQFYHQFVPEIVRDYITQKLGEWFNQPLSPPCSSLTLVIEQYDDGDYDGYYNHVYQACEAYLTSKLKSKALKLKVSRSRRKDSISFKLAEGESYSEEFEGIELDWSFVCKTQSEDSDNTEGGAKHFRLTCDPDHKDKVFESYLPFIVKSYDAMMEEKKELRLYSYEGTSSSNSWRSVKFEHPFTFDVLALDPEVKRTVIDDIDRFMKKKEFYKKVGRAWKRGYLLYGPPGTGKSSLIAAMANYLEFDIYDLQLSSVFNDSVLRRLLLSTSNKSILVIEDIDCSLGSAVCRKHVHGDGEDDDSSSSSDDSHKGAQISLSGLLNFIDGLWSSCGDERIVIFTTNYKDKLDPALLRPGRMDMHIHMSYLTMPAFKVLASNYLDIYGDHPKFEEIEQLIKATNVTPAQVAEELIRSDDVEVALSNLIDMLKGKIKSEQQIRKQELTDEKMKISQVGSNVKDENVQHDNGDGDEDGDSRDEVDVVNDNELSSE